MVFTQHFRRPFSNAFHRVECYLRRTSLYQDIWTTARVKVVTSVYRCSYLDCISCEVVGTSALGLTGLYALHMSRPKRREASLER